MGTNAFEHLLFVVGLHGPGGGGDFDVPVPGLDEDALAVGIEPFEEHDVLQVIRGALEEGVGRGGVPFLGAADATGGCHLASDSDLEGVEMDELFDLGHGHGIGEINPAACDVAEEVALEFHADGIFAPGEIELASDAVRSFVREVATKNGVAEENIHLCDNYNTFGVIFKVSVGAILNKMTALPIDDTMTVTVAAF
jgi:hypothetical protein